MESQASVSKTDTFRHNKNEPQILKTTPDSIKPVFGYRFIVAGDFNGDKKKERLVEHYKGEADHKELNKFYEGLSDYDQLVTLADQKNPYSVVIPDDPSIDTLLISSGGQLLGLSLLKNEGDLNGDNTDEVSYVVNWADWSNLNTWYIMTFRNHQWQELYSFPIWDWQLPDLPGTFNQYGLFGLQAKIIEGANDTLDQRKERELNEFPGLVKKIKNNKIQVIFRNRDFEDTLIVDLRQKNKRVFD